MEMVSVKFHSEFLEHVRPPQERQNGSIVEQKFWGLELDMLNLKLDPCSSLSLSLDSAESREALHQIYLH